MSTREKVLAGVLATLLSASGVLYWRGYWDTWADKQGEMEVRYCIGWEGVGD